MSTHDSDAVARATQDPTTVPTRQGRPRPGDRVGWYVDPDQPGMLRCWDGRAWATDGAGGPLRRARPPSEPLPRRVARQLQLGCLLPLAGAVVLPLLVMRWLEPPNGVGSLGAWETAVWSGVLAGWLLWAAGLIVWKGTEESFEDQLARSYVAAASWHATCKGLVIAVAVIGVLGTLGALFFLTMTAALSGVGSGL